MAPTGEKKGWVRKVTYTYLGSSQELGKRLELLWGGALPAPLEAGDLLATIPVLSLAMAAVQLASCSFIHPVLSTNRFGYSRRPSE